MITLIYCPNCDFPPEYCEYSGKIDGCIPFLKETLYKDKDMSNVKQRGKRILKPINNTNIKTQKILIHVVQRQPHKYQTIITGLDLYGIILSEAEKQFQKEFACTAKVSKKTSNLKSICIQGDVSDPLYKFLCKIMKIPPDMISLLEKKE